MRRWTDGRTWSPSRVLGNFLTYRELDTKRRTSHSTTTSIPTMTKSTTLCSYKSAGLIKQSFSICTSNNQKLHLISYYSKSDIITGRLQQPSNDPMLNQLVIPKGFYPDLNPLEMNDLHSIRDGLSSPCLSSSSHRMDSPTPSPSLSSSPSTCDDELMADLPSPYSIYSYPHYKRDHVDKHYHSLMANTSLHTLPIQDIAWERVPSSEDQRQLRALQNLLKL